MPSVHKIKDYKGNAFNYFALLFLLIIVTVIVSVLENILGYITI